jgi:electron transfer flavoprotein beta subunit
MNIVVCISSVPDTTTKINFTNDNSEIKQDGVQFVINPYDEFGLTKAMFIKENIGGTVTVINVGTIKNDPVIRKSLAIGADNAVRINMNPTDSFSTANEIAHYLKENPADLIIAGRESIDYNGGAVPGIIAEILDIPLINACIGLDITEGSVKGVREIDGGKETIVAKLPLIIGGQKGLVQESELRIPNMRGIMQARNKPLKVIDPFTNGDGFTKSISFKKPDEKNACKLIDKENVKELVKLLQTEAKVI